MIRIASNQDLVERYFERAAIMEYVGELSRERASQECFNKLGAWCKAKGRPLPQAVRDDFRKVITGKRKCK